MATQLSSQFDSLDFNHLALLIHKRFIEHIQTIDLMQQANSDQEKEEIALVALLDVSDDFNLELVYQEESSNTFQLSEFKQALERFLVG